MTVDLSQLPASLVEALRNEYVAYVLVPEPTEAEFAEAPTAHDWRLDLDASGLLQIEGHVDRGGPRVAYRATLLAIGEAGWLYTRLGWLRLGSASWPACGKRLLLEIERTTGARLEQEDAAAVLRFAEGWCDELQREIRRVR